SPSELYSLSLHDALPISLALAAASFLNVSNRTLIPNNVCAISSCRSLLIFFRLFSCAVRICWVRYRKCFCRRSDSSNSFLDCPRSEEHTSELQSLAYLVC